MELIEKATKTKFQTDVKHESIRPKVPKHRRKPSPHRYSENEEEIGEEEKEQPQQHSPAAQTGTGLIDRPRGNIAAGAGPHPRSRN